MAGSPPPSGGLRQQQPSLSLDPQDWSEAGELLIPPPDPADAAPYQDLPLSELLRRIEACHRDLHCTLPGSGVAIAEERLDHPPGGPSFGTFEAPAAGSGDISAVASSRLAPLALALLNRSWSAADREQLRTAADRLRQRLAGDQVSYVVNRNLNTSNVCMLRCGFCAFRRDEAEPGAYRLTNAVLAERALEAQRLGATELCLQAALDPQAALNGSHLAWAEALLQHLRQAAPGLHLHAFSPQELLFIAERDRLPLSEVLRRLRLAGLGSVPGTAAEVLSERVRRVICPEKLSARAWVAVMLQLQRQGIAATSTLMAGHVEQPADRVAHLLTLVALQRHAWQHQRCGFSEFVLLPFIGASAPAPLRQRVGRDQPDVAAMLLLTAQARLLLGPWMVHHQPSWVKLTLPQAVEALRWGCDDIGGTLMEEHITTMAGASGGTCQSPEALRRAVGAIGRPTCQRSTLYGLPEACGSDSHAWADEALAVATQPS